MTYRTLLKVLEIISFGLIKSASAEKEDISEERFNEFSEAKSSALERVLGPMDDLVYHSVIPFFVGGGLDMYYYSSYISGTVIATKELINTDGTGPKPNRMGLYELIACTRLEKAPSDSLAPDKNMKIEDASEFQVFNQHIWVTLTSIAHYSNKVVLQSGQTCEIPGADKDDTRCVIFDEFDTKGIPFEIEDKTYGLLLCIEIHRSELQYARKHDSASFLAKLKEAKVYPYSDLDREPVV